MAKTAEEILKDNVHLATTETLHSMKGNIIDAMREFAAQEVSMYSERVRMAIYDRYPDIFRELSDLIDAVK